MTQTPWHADPRQIADPFGEHAPLPLHRRYALLGADVEFRSSSAELLALVDAAYRDLPAHARAGPELTELRIELRLTQDGAAFGAEPPVARMLGGAGLLGVAMDAGNLALVNPAARRAAVQISPALLAFPYHARYELIEFAVFTLASRAQGLMPLHAGCVALNGAGALLVGDSGAGKSTLALHAMSQGLDFLTEDACFVEPRGLLATGIANFLHLRFDALRWIDDAALGERVMQSPVIRRRSGVEKHELDLRGGWARPAQAPLRLAHVVFVSSEPAGAGLLERLDAQQLTQRLLATQGYAAGLPGWAGFAEACAGLHGWALKRGAHPRDAAVALREMLMA